MAGTGRDIPTAAPERSSRYLLAVDGNATDLFYISMLLQRFQYNISMATSAASALKTASIAVPTLVVTAMDLPDMSGLDFMKQFRQDARAASVPFLFTLRDRAGDAAERCRRAGAYACLTSPVNADDLYRTVQKAIEPTPRSSIRINTVIPITINDKPLDCVEGECASVLSEHGMYVRTLRPALVNTRVRVQLALKGRLVDVDATVLYSHKFGEGPFKEPGMGLKFVKIAPQDQEFIRQVIREEITRGMPS